MATDFQTIPGDETAPGYKDLKDLENAGFTPGEIEDYKSQTTGELKQAGFSDDEVKKHFGIKDPDPAPMKDYVDTNLANYKFDNKDETNENANGQPKHITYAKTFGEALQAGLQISTSGLKARGEMPDMEVDPDSGTAMRIASQVGTFVGDIPAMAAGATIGSPLGPPGMAAGAFALPAMARKLMIDHYQKGDITTAQDFTDRLLGTAWEGAKGAATGALTSVAGPAAEAIAGPVAKFAAEALTMTGVSKGLEGKLPDRNDFIDSAIVMGGLHGIAHVAPKLMNIYQNTGDQPAEIAQATSKDPVLKGELVSQNPDLPIQARVPDPENPRETVKVPDDHHLTQSVAPNDENPTPSKIDVPASVEPKEITGKDTVERSDAEKQILSQMVDHPESKANGFKLSDLTSMFWDDRNPVKMAVEDAKKTEAATDIPGPANDPYTLMGNFRNKWTGVAARALSDSTVDFETGEKTGRGLIPILNDVPGKDINGLNQYMAAKRTLEIAETGKTTAIDPEIARQSVEDGRTRFEKSAQEVTDFRNRLMGYMKDSGLIDAKSERLMTEAGKAYVPMSILQDADPLTGKAKGRGGFFTKVKGAEEGSLLLNPLESIAQDVGTMVERAERNRTMTALADLPNSDSFMTEESPKNKPVFVGGKDIANALENQGVDTTDMDLSGTTIFRPKDLNLADNQTAIWRDGKVRVLTFDKDVSEAVKSLNYDPQSTGLLFTLLKPFASVLRAGTTLGAFTIRHFERSAIIASMQSDTPHIPFAGTLSAMGDMWKNNEVWNDFLSSGGANTAAEKLKGLMDQKPWALDKETGMLSSQWNTIKSKLDLMGALERFNEYGDTSVRLAEFKRSGGADADASPDQITQAAANARNITIDSGRAGSAIRALNSVIPFLNVGLQGTARMVENVQERPLQYAAMGLATITMPSILTFIHGRGDSRYDDAPDWEKDLFWVIPTDKWEKSTTPDALTRPTDQRRQLPDGTFEVNNGITYRVPKPFEAGVLLGSVPERVLSAYVDKNEHAFDHLSDTLRHGITPNLLPPPVAGAIEQASNHSFFTGNPIVSSHAEGDLPQYQYSAYTSETAKQLGRIIDAIPLARDIGGKNTKLSSPMVIDNYIQVLSGTLGKYAVNLLDKGLHAAGVGDVTIKPESTVADIPFVKEFVMRNASMNAQSLQTFRENFEQSQKVAQTISDRYKAGDFKGAMDLQVKYAGDEEKLSGISKAISNASTMIQMVNQDPKMTKQDKRQLIDSLTYQAIETAKMGNKMVDSYKGAMKQSQTQTQAPTPIGGH